MIFNPREERGYYEKRILIEVAYREVIKGIASVSGIAETEEEARELVKRGEADIYDTGCDETVSLDFDPEKLCEITQAEGCVA